MSDSISGFVPQGIVHYEISRCSPRWLFSIEEDTKLSHKLFHHLCVRIFLGEADIVIATIVNGGKHGLSVTKPAGRDCIVTARPSPFHEAKVISANG